MAGQAGLAAASTLCLKAQKLKWLTEYQEMRQRSAFYDFAAATSRFLYYRINLRC
jgi:hypothetical protein